MKFNATLPVPRVPFFHHKRHTQSFPCVHLSKVITSSITQPFSDHCYCRACPRCQPNNFSNLARGVAVEGEAVGGAAGEAAEGARDGAALDVVAELRGGLLALEGEEVGAEAGDVRGGHRGAGDGVLCISC